MTLALESLEQRIDKITEFVFKNSKHPLCYEPMIREFIKKHIDYGTCMVVYNNKMEIIGVVRWNMESNDTIAHILDIILLPHKHNNNLFHWLISEGLKMFPYTKYLRWERQIKYPDRKPRIYLIDKLLKRRNSNGFIG